MPINPYPEKDIRKKIISKIHPTIKKGRGKHEKGKIFVDGKFAAKVKVPNEHDRVMKKSKSQYIARDLHLSDSEFNDLIDCPLTGPQYYALLRKNA
jgi:hypothetical protein